MESRNLSQSSEMYPDMGGHGSGTRIGNISSGRNTHNVHNAHNIHQELHGDSAGGVGSRESVPQQALLSINELARCCSEETNKFLKQSVSNDRYCLELFRRAIVKRDDDAWSCIYQQYAPLVLTWVTQHQSAAPLLGQDGSGPLVNAAFAKFSQALTPAKMANFDSLAAVLKYLKMCVHSVVADEVRSRQSRQYEETLELIENEPASDDPADDVVSNISAQSLWQVIQEELNSEDERVLIYLAYIQGMKPGEISSQHRRLFPTVDDVYRIKRNVLERLRRNRRLQALFHQHF